jgi:hypothetical protein
VREKDPERADAIVADARTYARVLERLGVTDPWAVEVDRIRPVGAARVVMRWLALTPYAVIGAALGWLPYRLVRSIATRVAQDEDVLGTVKLLAGTALLTFTWLVEAIVIGWWRGALVGFAVFVAAPLTGYAALRWDEHRLLVVEALRHAALRRLRPEIAARIAERRRRLAQSVADALRA